MEKINIIDLMSQKFAFRCRISDDACEYWDYDFFIRNYGEPLFWENARIEELEILRENCRRILIATEDMYEDSFVERRNIGLTIEEILKMDNLYGEENK
jgi:hypothetical protein